jgi:hypothetical protein
MMPSNNLFFKVFSILLITHLLHCCSGCDGCEENCRYTELGNVDVRNMDNRGVEPVPVLSDTIPANAYMLEMSFYGKAPETTCENHMKRFLQDLITPNKSFAFKCEGPLYQSPDTIQHIHISSTVDLNDDFPQGSNLSDLFERKFQQLYDKNEYYLTDGIDSTAYWPTERKARFFLFANVDSIRPHRFIVEVIMTNGHVFSDTTETIYLQ